METIAIVFIVALVLILLWLLIYLLMMWKDNVAAREIEESRRALANVMVEEMHRKISRSRRATLPAHSAAIQRNWMAKRGVGLPPTHKTFGKRVIDPKERYVAGSPIEENPLAEEIEVVPEEMVDPNPHPRSRPHFSPGMYRRKTSPGPREVAIDVYGAGGPSGVPMQPIQEVIEPLPPIRRTASLGPLAPQKSGGKPPSKYLVGTPPRRTQSLRGVDQPNAGQLPLPPPARRSSQGSGGSASGGGGAASSSSSRRASLGAVAVDTKGGTAGYSRMQ